MIFAFSRDRASAALAMWGVLEDHLEKVCRQIGVPAVSIVHRGCDPPRALAHPISIPGIGPELSSQTSEAAR